jgi:hydroxymethylbilane synthase
MIPPPTTLTRLTIGSRGSQLALWQAHWVAARLKELGVETKIEIIKTTGDKITDVPLAKVGGKGLFTKEIEDALLEGRIDLAVHSLKDLPTELPAGLIVAAFPEREDARDALIGRKLSALPHAARIGTSSLRRAAQLRAMRPDLIVESIRGNLDTRLRRLDEGKYQAILLAAAGLRRLGWAGRIAEILDPDLMCPAVGQGALAIETRTAGAALEICARLDHAPTRAAVTAERAVLGALGGGCQVPIGAYAVVTDGKLALQAVVVSPDGLTTIRADAAGPASDAVSLGESAARELLENGAREVLAQVYGEGKPLNGQRVVITRARGQSAELSALLAVQGAIVVELPAIEFRAVEFTPPSGAYDWIIFTSPNGVGFFLERATLPPARVCAIGPATAAALERHSVKVDLIPHEYVGESIVKAFEKEDLSGKRILLPRAAVARDLVPDALRTLGATVDVLEVYRTVIPENLPRLAREVFNLTPRPQWVTLTSGSTIKNLLAVLDRETLAGIKLASIGPVTTAAARRHGLEVTVEANPSTMESLVAAMIAT